MDGIIGRDAHRVGPWTWVSRSPKKQPDTVGCLFFEKGTAFSVLTGGRGFARSQQEKGELPKKCWFSRRCAGQSCAASCLLKVGFLGPPELGVNPHRKIRVISRKQ